MVIRLTVGQLDKLSTLFLNLAQGLFLAAFALSFLAEDTAMIDSAKSLILGIIFTYFSLKLERHKRGWL